MEPGTSEAVIEDHQQRIIHLLFVQRSKMWVSLTSSTDHKGIQRT